MRKELAKMADWKTLENAKYTENDEWILVEGDTAKIGLTDYAQDQLSDIVFVDLPEVGDSVTKGEAFATVESVKAASAIINPIEGVVSEVNEELDGSPELINEDCWANHLYVLSPFEQSQYDGLLSSDEYAAYLSSL